MNKPERMVRVSLPASMVEIIDGIAEGWVCSRADVIAGVLADSIRRSLEIKRKQEKRKRAIR